MDKIAIHSVPRSGSTWLGNIFNSHPDVNFNFQPLFSYAFKGRLSDKSSFEEIDKFFNEILKSEDNFISQVEGKDKGIIPVFKKNEDITHVCYKEVRYHNILPNMLSRDNEVKVILLIRNPLAVLNSWSNSPKEFRVDLGWDFNEEWKFAEKKNLGRKEEFNGYLKWVECTKLFHRLEVNYPKRALIVNYEDLLLNTQQTVINIFSFCNLSLSLQTVEFLEASKYINNHDPYSVYKNKNDDMAWMKNIPKNIISEILNDFSFKQINARYNWTLNEI